MYRVPGSVGYLLREELRIQGPPPRREPIFNIANDCDAECPGLGMTPWKFKCSELTRDECDVGQMRIAE